jgi:signal transduction histidine kinase
MMECLINDMLDQAKIDNDAFKLNEEYFDLPKVVYKSLNIVKE